MKNSIQFLTHTHGKVSTKTHTHTTIGSAIYLQKRKTRKKTGSKQERVETIQFCVFKSNQTRSKQTEKKVNEI